MREIKFRAWTGDKMLYDIIPVFGTKHEQPAIIEIHQMDMFRIKTVKYLLQFTGLHDKNGREIYDGDILLKDGDFIRVVRHEPPLFYSVPIDKWSIEHNIKERVIFPSTFLDSEVIGNIYENPELLKDN